MKTPLVNSDWLHQNFDDPDVIILDASTATNMAGLTVKHEGLQILGAMTFDLKGVFSDKDSTLPNMMPSPQAFTHSCQALGINSSSKLVIYDNLGLYASPRAWCMFRTLGHKNVAVLDGGLNAWISDGGETEALTKRPYAKGDFVAKFDDRKIKNSAQILDNITAKTFRVIDARSSGRFNAEVPEPRPTTRSGRIPNSYNLPHAKLSQYGKFLPLEELRTLFEKTNLGDGPLVFSCGSGMTACIDILGASLVLKNELALYDGSWSEWGKIDADWPVE